MIKRSSAIPAMKRSMSQRCWHAQHGYGKKMGIKPENV